MDALATEPSLSYTDTPPLLVVGSSDAALRRVRETAEGAGHRIGAGILVEQASNRLRQQVSASAVWIEIDRDCGAALDDLLADLEATAEERSLGAVLSITNELIDSLGERLFDGPAQILVDAGAVERTAALAAVTAFAGAPGKMHDVAQDPAAARLRQLSEEVSRIAASLARLSAGATGTFEEHSEPLAGASLEVSAETVRSVIRARQMRSRFLPGDLFADPAWDMLLDLLQAELAQARVPVSSLCSAAAVPGTTALRWLKSMAERGIFIRRPDPEDGRRIFVELSPAASTAMRRYFASVAPAPVL